MDYQLGEKNKRKRIIIISSVILAVILIIAAIIIVYKYQESKKTVTVIPVSNLYTSYWGDNVNSYGMVSSDFAQEIYPEDEKTISEIFVNEGDSVTIGQQLLQYDKTALEIEVAQKELELKTVDNDITNAQKELKMLQNTKASTGNNGGDTPVVPNVPVEPEPSEDPSEDPSDNPTDDPTPTPVAPADVTVYTTISANSLPYGGDGSSGNPYKYLCTADYSISPEFMMQLLGISERVDFSDSSQTVTKSFAAVFEVRESDSNYGELIQSSKIDGTAANYTPPVTTEQTGLNFAPNITALGGISQMDSGFKIKKLANNYNDMGYTSAELKAKIAETNAQISQLQLDKKQAKIDLDKANLALSNSTVVSKIDGTVKSLIDVSEAKSNYKPFMTISGENTYYVTGTISEDKLGEITPGTEITAMSYETGNSYIAQIVDIDTYPVEDDNFSYESNPNNSTYPFTAVIQNSDGLYNGLYLEMTMSTTGNGADSEALYIQKMYIRTDDAGSYVMKRGEDNRLVKQYVEIGKIINSGYWYGIVSGLTMDDYIAFPYGKTVKEGARTVLEGDEEFENSEGEFTDGNTGEAEMLEGEDSIIDNDGTEDEDSTIDDDGMEDEDGTVDSGEESFSEGGVASMSEGNGIPIPSNLTTFSGKYRAAAFKEGFNC